MTFSLAIVALVAVGLAARQLKRGAHKRLVRRGIRAASERDAALMREFDRADKALKGPPRVSPLQQAAYHEAGHIVMAAILRVPVRGGFIDAQGGGKVSIDCVRWLEDNPNFYGALLLALVNVAGPLIEAKLACCDVDESLRGASHDLADAQTLIELGVGRPKSRVPNTAMMTALARVALVLLYRCRDAVESVERLLIAEHTVDGAKIAAIVEVSPAVAAARATIDQKVMLGDLIRVLLLQGGATIRGEGPR